MSTEPTTEIRSEDIQFGVPTQGEGKPMHPTTPQQAVVVKKEEARLEGRPTVMTEEVIAKLEAGFMYSYTDAEACLYAGISTTTLWRYEKENPSFAKRKAELRLTPNLQAKKELVDDIKGNPAGARWWAERKIRHEFQPSAKVEHSGNVVMDTGMNPELDKALDEASKEFAEKINAIESRKRTPEEIAGTKVEALPDNTQSNEGRGTAEDGVVGKDS